MIYFLVEHCRVIILCRCGKLPSLRVLICNYALTTLFENIGILDLHVLPSVPLSADSISRPSTCLQVLVSWTVRKIRIIKVCSNPDIINIIIQSYYMCREHCFTRNEVLHKWHILVLHTIAVIALRVISPTSGRCLE
jgi:hypothetical protein